MDIRGFHQIENAKGRNMNTQSVNDYLLTNIEGICKVVIRVTGKLQEQLESISIR